MAFACLAISSACWYARAVMRWGISLKERAALVHRAVSSQHRSIRAELLVILRRDVSIQGMPASGHDHALRAPALQRAQQGRLSAAQRRLVNSERLEHVRQLQRIRHRTHEIAELVGADAEVSRQLLELVIFREAEGGVVGLVSDPDSQGIKHFFVLQPVMVTSAKQLMLACAIRLDLDQPSPAFRKARCRIVERS